MSMIKKNCLSKGLCVVVMLIFLSPLTADAVHRHGFAHNGLDIPIDGLACPFENVPHSQIVDLEDNFIYSGLRVVDRDRVDVSIPAGRYSVEIFSWDSYLWPGHPHGSTPPVSRALAAPAGNEIFHIEFKDSSSAPIAFSGQTQDIPDGVDPGWWFGMVDSEIEISRDVTRIYIVGGYDSVFSGCMRLIELDGNVCGDGRYIEGEAGEQCDDGNLDNGDGCDSLCQVETPTVVCDDGEYLCGNSCERLGITGPIREILGKDTSITRAGRTVTSSGGSCIDSCVIDGENIGEQQDVDVNGSPVTVAVDHAAGVGTVRATCDLKPNSCDTANSSCVSEVDVELDVVGSCRASRCASDGRCSVYNVGGVSSSSDSRCSLECQSDGDCGGSFFEEVAS